MSLLGKISKTTLIVVISIVIVLVAVRIALPYIIKHEINKKLQTLPDYTGHVDDVSMHIYRGAYSIDGIELKKKNGEVPVPFLSVGTLDLSVDWKELFHGSLVAKIYVYHPKLNFVQGSTKAQSQTTMDKGWQKTLTDLFPIRINSFRIEDGEVHFRNFHSDPKVNIYMGSLQVLATNLTNSRKVSKTLASTVEASGTVLSSGSFRINVKLDPFAEKPTFNLAMQVTGIDLVKLNDFLKAYGKFDVHKGTFSMYSEVAASEGKFEGYVKPLMKDVEVVRWKEDIKKPFFELAWKAVVGLVKDIFTNPSKDQVATKAPFSGTFDNPEVGVWSTIWELIRNAFIQALMPGLDRSINIKDVKK